MLDALVGSLRPGSWAVVHSADFRREVPDESTPPELAERFEWVVRHRRVAELRAGQDLTLATRLPCMLLSRGLSDVDIDSYQLFLRGATDWATFWRRTAAASLVPMAAAGELDAAEVESALSVYDNPELRWWGPLQVIARGRRPA
ncbi:MAG: hypothetical protein EXR63_02400 [Dehalococcoidia bacterium]|nr:hypothetical protein [Dehalococcoidia bacterium]